MTQNRAPVIGVTGISGSGASTVAGFLEELGGTVVSADRLAREAVKKGLPAHCEVVRLFGREVLQEDGEINRKALGKIVFGNQVKLKQLENIVHPVVLQQIEYLIHNCTKNFSVIDAPLLIESGLSALCDETWFVTAPNEERLARITKRDGIDRTLALMRINSRQDETELAKKADFVLCNQGDRTELKKQVAKRLDVILREKNT